jgi:hypothetical protein
MKNESYKMQVITIVTRKLNIKDCECHGFTWNLDKIEKINQKIFNDIKNYFEAYDAWRDFIDEIYEEDKAGKLSELDISKLVELSNRREDSRISLVNRLNN